MCAGSTFGPPAEPGALPPKPHAAAAPVHATLRRLFLTLFLRGRGARGIRKSTAPRSVGRKLWGTLLTYAALSLLALLYHGQSVFALAVYLHAMTFVFLGMFVAASAGEVLFNRDEADILLHRPIPPRALLWAKIRVLVEVSLWIAFALNLAGLFVGTITSDGGWRFPLVHGASIVLEALFCTACVVLVYQLCLRWFGREKLDALMTTAQVAVAITAVLASQLLPQMAMHFGTLKVFTFDSWWIVLLPPAWFAGFDDLLAGTPSVGGAVLAVLAVGATAFVLWAAFGKLAQAYEVGLQTMSERPGGRRRQRAGRGWTERLAALPPLCWLLRDPVARWSFRLTLAYLVRDRDVKLRVYPAIAPLLVLPVIFMLQGQRGGRGGGEFGIAFTAAYVGLAPLFVGLLLQYSPQYQASDMFHAAPIGGPARVCNGARVAVICLFALPLAALCVPAAYLMHADMAHLLLLVPGFLSMPVYALVPYVWRPAVPLARPTEEAKSAGRGVAMMGAVATAALIAGVTALAWHLHFFGMFLALDAAGMGLLYVLLKLRSRRVGWESLE